MKRQVRRILTGLLAMALCLGLFPASSLAAEPNPGEPRLVRYYRFDEWTGNQAADSTGADHAVRTDAVKSVEGKFGRAAQFGAVNAYVELKNSNAVLENFHHTISAWVRMDAGMSNQNEAILSTTRPNDGSVYGYWLAVFNYTFNPIYFFSNHTYGVSNNTKEKLAVGEWTHLVLVRDGDPGNLRIYVNGKPAKNIPVNGGFKVANTILVGANRDNRNAIIHNLHGAVDELRIYDGSMSDAQVAELYKMPAPETAFNEEQFNHIMAQCTEQIGTVVVGKNADQVEAHLQIADAAAVTELKNAMAAAEKAKAASTTQDELDQAAKTLESCLNGFREKLKPGTATPRKVIEDSDSHIIYDQPWGLYGPLHYKAFSAKDTVTKIGFKVNFIGSSLALHSQVAFNGPILEVYVDGEKVHGADFYSPTTIENNVNWAIAGLEYKEHCVHFVYEDRYQPIAYDNAVNKTGGNFQAAINYLVVNEPGLESTSDPVIPVTGLTLDQTEVTLEIGGTVTLTASAVPANARPQVSWSSDNASVATVTDGVVTAVGKGTATITASVNQIEAKAVITVHPSLQERLNQANPGDTVSLEQDAAAEQLTIPTDVTLDLNGFTLTAQSVSAVPNGRVTDSAPQGKNGLLRIPADGLELTSWDPANGLMPLWNGADGYIFEQVKMQQKAPVFTEDGFLLKFRPVVISRIKGVNNTQRSRDCLSGGSKGQIQIGLRLSWVDASGKAKEQVYYFSDALVQQAYGEQPKAFVVRVKNVSGLGQISQLRAVPFLWHDPIVACMGTEESITLNQNAE